MSVWIHVCIYASGIFKRHIWCAIFGHPLSFWLILCFSLPLIYFSFYSAFIWLKSLRSCHFFVYQVYLHTLTLSLHSMHCLFLRAILFFLLGMVSEPSALFEMVKCFDWCGFQWIGVRVLCNFRFAICFWY